MTTAPYVPTIAVVHHPAIKWPFISTDLEGGAAASVNSEAIRWCEDAMRGGGCRRIGEAWVDPDSDRAQAVGIALRDDGERVFHLLRKSAGERLDTSLSAAATAIAVNECSRDGATCTAMPVSSGVKAPIDPQAVNELTSQIAIAAWPGDADGAEGDAWVAHGFPIGRQVEAESTLLAACAKDSGETCQIHRRVVDTSLLIYRDESTSRLSAVPLVADDGMDAYRLMQQPVIPEEAIRGLLEAEIRKKLIERCGVSSDRCHVVDIVNAHTARPQVGRIPAR